MTAARSDSLQLEQDIGVSLANDFKAAIHTFHAKLYYSSALVKLCEIVQPVVLIILLGKSTRFYVEFCREINETDVNICLSQ